MDSEERSSAFPTIPAVGRLLQHPQTQQLIAGFGRAHVTASIRSVLADLRASLRSDPKAEVGPEAAIIHCVADLLTLESRPSLRPVFNLTGVVLHTNLGRAVLPESASDAVLASVSRASNLEYDLATGCRGDRDAHVETQISRLTGAPAATVVNNNAAAILLVLNTLANRKEVPVSRGELIEIGGSFRLPEIMTSSGCRLREVGTTNRTHLADYESAIGPKTALLMKVYPSNYVVKGFTAQVSEPDLARLGREKGLPFIIDLGSGTLIDLKQFGLPHEPTVAQSIRNGADIVTFSGDKLLGGPQVGIIAGRADLVEAIKRNPLRRALRVGKMTVAALAAVLDLYKKPEHLPKNLPTLRLLTRPLETIRTLAESMRTPVARRLVGLASVEVIGCDSQIGSGALPLETIPSAGLAVRALNRDGSGAAVERIATAFRSLPIPVVGRIEGGAFILDLRCLEDEGMFVAQLPHLELAKLS